MKKLNDASTIVIPTPEQVFLNVRDMDGVNDSLATTLEESGVCTKQDILALGENGLDDINGIGPATAKRLMSISLGE